MKDNVISFHASAESGSSAVHARRPSVAFSYDLKEEPSGTGTTFSRVSTGAIWSAAIDADLANSREFWAKASVDDDFQFDECP